MIVVTTARKAGADTWGPQRVQSFESSGLPLLNAKEF